MEPRVLKVVVSSGSAFPMFTWESNSYKSLDTSVSKRQVWANARDEIAGWMGLQCLEYSKLYEESAEKDILVFLLAVVEEACKRKSRLLQTLQKFHHIAGKAKHARDFMRRDTDQQYDWLVGNLLLTNASLKMALAHLRILYYKAYSTK